MKKPSKAMPKASQKHTGASVTAEPVASTPATNIKNVTPAPDTTTAFLREVDAAMQQERLLAVWHTSKWFILGAVVLLVLAVASQQAWLAWRTHQARTLAAQWYAYTELKTDAERQSALPTLLQTTSGGTHALAVYKLAAMQHTGEEKAKAYMQLVNDTSVPQWLRDISRLNAALALLGTKPEEAKAHLEVLAQSNAEQLNGPAYAPALELLALLAQQSGDVASAKGYTKKLLQQPGMPSDMRQRALQRYGALGGEAS